MKPCPQCGAELATTNFGYVCASCGYHAPLEPTSSQPVPPPPAPDPVPAPPPPAPPTPLTPEPPVPPTPTYQTAPAVPSSGYSVPAAPAAPALPAKVFNKKWIIIAVAAVVALAGLGTGAYAYYLYKETPKNALASYLAKSNTAKTGKFSGTATFKGKKTTDGKATFKINGSSDISDIKKAKIEAKMEGSVSASGFPTDKIGLEIRAIDKTGYLKVNAKQILTAFGMQEFNGIWLKYTAEESFFDDKCKESLDAKTSELLAKLPVKDPKLVKLFDKVDGKSVRQYSGEVDLDKLEELMKNLNKDLPADCKLDYPFNFDNTSLRYTLWTSPNFDRISLDIGYEDGEVAVLMDTYDYNQPVKIEAPKGAKDLNDVLGASELGQGPAQARDAQRKADLRMVQNALETYYNDNNYYPSGTFSSISSPLVPEYIPGKMPKDPAGASYVYTPSQCSSSRCQKYVLQANMEAESSPYSIESIAPEPASGASAKVNQFIDGFERLTGFVGGF